MADHVRVTRCVQGAGVGRAFAALIRTFGLAMKEKLARHPTRAVASQSVCLSKTGNKKLPMREALSAKRTKGSVCARAAHA